MSRQHLPARADAMVRANQTQHEAVRPQGTQDDSQAKSARVLDAAFIHSGKRSDEAAFSLEISESLINRMRSPDARETISLKQICKLCLDLGPRFAWEFHVAFHKEHALAKIALAETLQSLSLFAVGSGE